MRSLHWYGWLGDRKKTSASKPFGMVVLDMVYAWYMVTNRYVDVVYGQVNTPRLNPSQTGWYLIFLPRRDGRLSCPR